MTTPDTEFQAIIIAIFFANAVIYFIFYWIGILANKLANKNVASKRLLGCIGVVLFTIVGMWYASTHLVGRLGNLSNYAQGHVVGQVMGAVMFPAIVVLAVVWIRAKIEKRKGTQN